MLLEHLRSVFPWDQRHAELGPHAVVRNVGDEAAETEQLTGAAEPGHTEANASDFVSSCTEARSGDQRVAGSHLPHGACETRRSFGAGEQSSHGAFGDQVERGTAADGRAARPRVGGHRNNVDCGPSALSRRQIATAYMASVSSPEALLQSVYWNQFKKTFQRDLVRWQCSVDSKTQTIMHFIIKAMVSRGTKEKFGEAPAGVNVRELQQMLDDMLGKPKTERDSSR